MCRGTTTPSSCSRSSVSADSSQGFICALFSLSPSEPNDFLKKTYCSVWQKLFCPTCPPFFFPYILFPVLSAKVLCVSPLSSSVLPSQYVHTVISFGFFPLCSLLGCCPSFLLFSGSPFTTVLLGQHDQPLHFRACGLLLAWRCMRGVLQPHCSGTRRALSCTGGG